MRRPVVIVATIAGFAAALAAFAYLCATGAAREALGVVGCLSPCIAWAAYDAGKGARR